MYVEMNFAGIQFLLADVCVVMGIYFIPLWVWAGVSDWRTSTVSGINCILLILGVHIFGMLFLGFVANILLLLLSLLFFLPHEFTFIGDADLIIPMHIIVLCSVMNYSLLKVSVMLTIYLIMLPLYILALKLVKKIRWKRGMLVPNIPPYTAVVLIMLMVDYSTYLLPKYV